MTVCFQMTPSRCRATPAPQDEDSVEIIPHLKPNIASDAAKVRTKAQGLRLDKTGASKAKGQALIWIVAPKIVWIANQRAKFRITPTTAAVTAESAAFSLATLRSLSIKGAPTNIQRKHGVNVTQVATNPPIVPASRGDSVPGLRKAAIKPTNWSTMISGPGVVSAIPRPSNISVGVSHP